MSCSPISDAAAMRAVAMKNVHIAEEAPAEMEARTKAGPIGFFGPPPCFFDPPPCLFDTPLVFLPPCY